MWLISLEKVGTQELTNGGTQFGRFQMDFCPYARNPDPSYYFKPTSYHQESLTPYNYQQAYLAEQTRNDGQLDWNVFIFCNAIVRAQGGTTHIQPVDEHRFTPSINTIY
jgi:hypothetical protein